jgi:hypothetical protein
MVEKRHRQREEANLAEEGDHTPSSPSFIQQSKKEEAHYRLRRGMAWHVYNLQ